MTLGELIVQKLPVAVGVWAVVFIADYYLTIWGAKLYDQVGEAVSKIEGSYELNEVFEKDVNKKSMLSLRFLFFLILSCLLIAYFWFQIGSPLVSISAFKVVYGVILLREAPVMLRHGRNISIYTTFRKHGGMEGQTTRARWFVQNQSFWDFFLFTLLFLFLFYLNGDWFMLGGVIGCGLLSLRTWVQSRPPKNP